MSRMIRRGPVLLLALVSGARAGDWTLAQPRWSAGETHRVKYDLNCRMNIELTTTERRDPPIVYAFREHFTETVVAVDEGGQPVEVDRTYEDYRERFPETKEKEEGEDGFLRQALRLEVKQGRMTPSGKGKRGFPKTLGQPGSWCRWGRLLHGKALEAEATHIYVADALKSLIPPELSSRLAKPQFSYASWKPVELDRRPALQFDLALVCETERLPKGKLGLIGLGTLTVTRDEPKRVELKMDGQAFAPEGGKTWAGEWSLTLSQEPVKSPPKPADGN